MVTVENADRRGEESRTVLLLERQRFAQQMHDDLSQIMTGLALQIAGAKLTDPGNEHARPYLDRAAELVDQAIRTIRQTIRSFLAAPQNSADLVHDLRESIGALAEGTSVRVTIHSAIHTDLEDPLGRDLFRIAQEAVSNALRHGRPSWVDVSLSVDAGGGVNLDIEDDGCGVDPIDSNSTGLGLVGMHTRAAAHGGTLSQRNPTQGGTAVEARIPRVRDGD